MHVLHGHSKSKCIKQLDGAQAGDEEQNVLSSQFAALGNIPYPRAKWFMKNRFNYDGSQLYNWQPCLKPS